ncbi:MAG: sodium/solute symporter [Opitutaceae bacterium]|nr:sodium/solute symporter [Cephaloticoccus sp.]MCP5530406.1 sodium/solute symporter [Opitutaceae bacterium]
MTDSTTLAGFHGLDVALIITYLVALSSIGLYFSRRQRSLKEFIRGKSGYGFLTLGLSLMAALNSGVDYVQAPALIFGLGVIYLTSIVAWVFIYPWATRVTIPFYQRLNVYSAYEYLELRFNTGVRLMAAGIFVLWRVGWMGAAIYVPCLAVNAVTGGQLNMTMMVLVLGVVVTSYTMLGGMQAVVWTDLIQCCVMFTGLAMTVYVVVDHIPGGVGEVFSLAAQSGHLRLTAAPVGEGLGFWASVKGYFSTEITFAGIVLLITLSRASSFTADQVAIQRFQSAKSLSDTRKMLIVDALAGVLWIMVLGFVGLALFAYYQHFPFPEGLNNDRVLPYFIGEHFPVGVTGLVIAAIFAASLSSVDAALNSTASIIVVDFYNRIWLQQRRPVQSTPPDIERKQVRVSRCATIVLGIIMMVIGINIDRMGELYQAVNKILGAFMGPLFGMFFLGMFSRTARAGGVLLGAALGLSCSCFTSFFPNLPWLQRICGRLFGEEFVAFFQHLSWQWPSIIGILVTLFIGLLASRIIPRPATSSPALTFREVMKLPPPSTD